MNGVMLRNLVAAVAVAGFMTACTTGKDVPGKVRKMPEAAPQAKVVVDTRSPSAMEAESRGDFQAAAREYYRLADAADSPLKEDYLLHAAATLLRGNFIEQADRAARVIPSSGLPTALAVRHRTLLAKIALQQSKLDEAYSLLAESPSAAAIPDDVLIDFFQLRAEINTQRNDALAALRDYIAYRPALKDLPEIHVNQSRLWNMLMRYDDTELQQLAQQAQDDTESGWLVLAHLAKSFELPTIQLSKEIQTWRDRYPLHPATEELIQSVLALQGDQTYAPKQIALLLPESGAFAPSGTAVRDGFLAAFFARANRDYTPLVRVYDTGELVEQTLRAYDQAVQDGAEFIIGPLSKESVSTLATAERLPVPTLGLNYAATEGPSAANLYQFGLAPEDEARQVAERAWLDGNNQAIALVPEGSWGARIVAAFRSNWEQLGGSTIEVQSYPANANDFSDPLQQLLSIDESRARAQDIRAVIGQTVKFEPRRRKDVDFIFIAALPHQARQIRPQLKFFYAADLQIYGTSHVFTGSIDAARDRDMDDVVFCDMPWTINPDADAVQLWRAIETQFPKAAPVYKRLYALGADSFNIIPHLRRLSAYPFQTHQGQTGYLSINEYGHFRRQLVWAKFVNGRPVPADSPAAEAPAQSPSDDESAL